MESGDHLFLVYFFYGLSFLLLGVLLIAQRPLWHGAEAAPPGGAEHVAGSLYENLWFLGMFGIFHGLNEWVDMSLMSDAWTRLEGVMRLVSSFLYAMSTLCLFEFALSLISINRPRAAWLRWLPISVFFVWLGLLFIGVLMHWQLPSTLLVARGWIRYCFGLAGGLLTCLALLSQRELLASPSPDAETVTSGTNARRLRKLLVVAAIFFGINAVLSTVMAAESSLVQLGDIPHHDVLRGLFVRMGISSPLALFRAASAVVICFAVIQALLAIDREQNRLLLKNQAELEESNRRLRESYGRLKETQQQLVQSEKMSAVGTLVSGVAHEFNNILSGLKGYTQLARASRDIDQIHRDLEAIEEAANRTIDITRNLLTWVRPEKRRREFIDPTEVIRQAVALVKSTSSRRNIRVEVELTSVGGLPLSKAEVQDIVMNLILNAAHAIGDRREGRIVLRSLLRDDNVMELSVEDNGCGIPPENLDKIFLPFFTTKGALGGSETPGTGLGLYVVYGIVKNAGGDVVVESEVGKGTRFCITLPARACLWQDLASPENPEVCREGTDLLLNMRLLVVEDETLLREALVDFLEDRAQEVCCASNGREALKMAAKDRYDLIFVDLMMPGISGLETLRHLQEVSRDTPVVLMTTHPDSEMRTKVMQRGAADLIRKPFDLPDLSEVLRRVARMQVRRSLA